MYILDDAFEEAIKDFVGDAVEEVIFPPSDLYSYEPQWESNLHLRQFFLLFTCLEWWWRDRNDFFVLGNATIYYSSRQPKSKDFPCPDFFVVLGVERKPRNSWVVWAEEGKYPHVIIELLSSETAEIDRGLKKQIYQDTFRTPDYFWFDPETLEFRGFHLVDGEYQELQPNEDGWLWSQQLGLYLGIHRSQLRFFTPQGQLVPTLEETSEQESQRAERERERAERLAQRLRDLGIDPATI